MWSRLENIFQTIGLEYSRQGSYVEGETLPNSFFTFWNYDTPEDGFYDNVSHKTIWIWQIYFYTNDPNLIYSKMDEFIELAKQEGFIVNGKGNDISSGVPDYFGRMVRISYMENYIKEE